MSMTTADPAAPALAAHGVWHRYGFRRGPWALADVDLTVPQGSIVALVGPNGAGKSTLMRAWLGFERPTRGSVAVLGTDLAADRSAAIAQVGYLAQSGGLYPNLDAERHLQLAESLHPGFDVEGARAIIEELGAPLRRAAGSLSGGQRKHLELALALGTHAPVLILDEPLVALDVLARTEFLRVLGREMRTRGRTAILSSHIVRDIEMACDRLVVLSSGRVRLDDTLAAALEAHRLSADPVGEPIGRIRRLDDTTTWLSRGATGGATPTLEDLVLGYLVADDDERHGPAVV